MYILHSKHVCFTEDGRLEVYDDRLATKLNKFLKTYDSGIYKFQPGEEGLFWVPSDQIQLILSNFLSVKSTKSGSNEPRAV